MYMRNRGRRGGGDFMGFLAIFLMIGVILDYFFTKVVPVLIDLTKDILQIIWNLTKMGFYYVKKIINK